MPIITPNKTDITVSPSENVTLSCHSTEPVTWLFSNDIKYAYATKVLIPFRQRHISK